MPAIIAAILLIPLAAYALSRRFSAEPESRCATFRRCAALFAAGLAAASPFLTTRAVGTGEAYNYSLAVADAVTQMRAGEIPPLVGQTAFAFNGRIHPLRNAPYLFYFIGGVDFLTAHRLSFWELQNLSLAFSLVAAAFAAYGALRWGPGCPRPMASLLAVIYAWSPAVLAAAFTDNLFMTVHAAVFVPLVLGACFRPCRHPSRRADLVLGAALAGAWLAHPPVALWLTGAVAVVRGLVFLRHATWSAARGLAAAAILGAALAGFGFASVAAISAAVGFFDNGIHFGEAIWPIIRSAFPAALLPVSRTAGQLGDFQFGYASWGLLALVTAALLGARHKPRSAWAIGGAVATILLLLTLTLPVPWLTVTLWDRGPVAAQALTNVWPMQRLYLVGTGLVAFAAALALPKIRFAPQRALLAALALGAAWTGWEARLFVTRGWGMRWSPDATARSHLDSNLDLTVTAYAFLGTPSSFVNGVTDPLFEFRILREGKVIASPFQAARAAGPVVARGSFAIAAPADPALEIKPQHVTLQPGGRYLLTFDFHGPPRPGELQLTGPSLQRRYILPAAGGPEGFGMEPGNRRSLSVWTSQDHAEDIEISFKMKPGPGRPAASGSFADFTLQAVDLSALPIRLESLLPLRFTVDAPGPNCYVDTPRRYLPGYAATVNGRPLIPLRSPLWDVMVPVPPGRSTVEIRYAGAPVVRAAFWLSCFSWLGFLGWLGGLGLGLRWGDLVRPPLRRAGSWLARRRRAALAAGLAGAGVAGALALGWQRMAYLAAYGPLRVTLYLPFERTGQREPVISTGHSGAGTVVFLDYPDENHVRVGADVWGTLYLSDPVAVNYFQQQNLVVDSSALYPLDHPRVRALGAAEQDRLRAAIRIELNGRLVQEEKRPAYESTVAEVAIGENRMGASGLSPRFSGEILRVKRLPPSREWILTGEQRLRLRLAFPTGHLGITEPLVAAGRDGRDGVCAVTYLPAGRVRFTAFSATGQALASAERMAGPGQDHEMEWAMADGGAVRGWFDGEQVLGPSEARPLSRPEILLIGQTAAPVPGIDARFTGSALAVENSPPHPVPPAGGDGPMRLIAILPQGKTGRQEPLVTTGRTGRGDFAYVVYLDDHHIRLGYDHWGVSGGLSGPIAIDYGLPHEFVISLGSLYPDETGAAWGETPSETRRSLKSALWIRLDGREVYRAAFTAHPSAPGEVAAGLNAIGGSSCDPAFTGVLYSAERLGLPPR